MRVREPLSESSNRRSRRTIVAAIVFIAIASAGILGTRYAKELWTAGEQPPKVSNKLQLPPEQPPDPIHLTTTSTSGIDSHHIIDGNFTIVNRMTETSEECRGIFQSLFVNLSGSTASAGQVMIADPGQDFEATDAIRGGLPFRRLVFAGLGSKACFIYFERGGAMYPSSCLAVMDYTQRKAIWIGEARKKVWSLKELRSMVSRGDFRDNAGPAC